MHLSILCILMVCVTIAAGGSVCEDGGGRCLSILTHTCDNKFVRGRCPGASHIRCCYDCKKHDGVCQSDSKSCPGGYVSGSCNGPANIRCCRPTPTSGSTPDSACKRAGGECKNAARESCDSLFRMGLCPGKSYIQCCRPGTFCGARSKSLACNIKNSPYITLATSHPSGVRDNAYASDNINDVCDGKQAKRSSYSVSCPGGVSAPGGETCLSASILGYVLDIANLKQENFMVNEFAGACHSAHSKHYEGRAVDLSVRSKTRAEWEYWMNLCRSYGGIAYGPDHRGHSSHVHCEI